MELVSKELSNPLYSRISITYIFFLFGTFSANFAVRIPDLQTQYHLSTATLGLVLAFIPAGGFIILFIVGRLIKIFGSRIMTIFGVILLHISYPLVFLMPNKLVLAPFLMIIGFESTITNISMNSQGLTIERDAKKSIISSLHAFFAIGTVAGAVLGSLLISLGFNAEMHLLISSIVFLPFTLVSLLFLRKDNPKSAMKDEKNAKKYSFFDTFKSKQIWIIGFICFIASFGEWTLRHWSVIYVNNYTTHSIAALGFAFFFSFMTIGRLIGDFLANRYSIPKIIRTFGFIAFIGMMITVATNNLIVIFVGFAFIGLGLSILIPFSYKLSENTGVVEIGSGLAGVAIFASVANISEPILVGQIAQISSLTVSFALVGFMLVLIVFIGKGLQGIRKENVLNNQVELEL